MKKRLLLNGIFVFILILASNAQLPTPIQTFNFNGSMSNLANNISFPTNLSTGYGTDRFGVANNALALSNGGTIATINNLPYGGSSRTISIWAAASTFAVTNTIFNYGINGGDYGATLNELSVRVSVGSSFPIASHISEIETWEHYVFTFDNSVNSIYKNGILLHRSGVSTNTTPLNNLFCLGTNASLGGEFNGKLDDLKIYNVALTDDQVNTLHTNELNSSLPPPPSNGLLAYYNFSNNYNSHNGVHNMFEMLGPGYAAPTFTTGKYGQAINLSLANGTLRSTNSLTNALTESFTVAFWMMPTGTQNNYSTAFEIGSSCFYRYDFAIPQSYQYGTAIVPTTGASPQYRTAYVPKPRDDRWIHVTMVYTKTSPANGGPATLKLYLNQGGLSQILMTQVSTNAIHMFNNVFTIGGGTNADGTLNLTKRFKGFIDEFYVYNRALSTSEIARVMNNSQGTLPAKLGNFTAQLKSQTTNLQWSTITEINTSHFEVEYSNSANEFKKVATVEASGNSNILKNYTSHHNINKEPIHYYRLKMVDKDGKFSYSEIVRLKSDTKGLLLDVYPTIVTNTANINITAIENSTASVEVYNTQGQKVQQQNIVLRPGTQSIKLDASVLSKGNYIIRLVTNQQQLSTQIIKQ